MKPNDILTISKGKDKLKVTRKAFEVIYQQHGFKIDDDPAVDDQPVKRDGDTDQR